MTPTDPHQRCLQAVLETVADPDCRSILAATAGPMTASELAATTNIPRSTVYRKLDAVHQAGLVEATCRFESDGKHPTEYIRSFDRIQLRVTDDGQFALRIDDGSAPDPGHPATEPPRIRPSDRIAALGDLFVSTTGTTTVVDSQRESPGRSDSDEATVERQVLEEYIADAIVDDGLADVIDGAEPAFPGD